MKNFKVSTTRQKTGLLALASAIAVPVLVATPQTAQADPPRHALAYGYRNNDHRYDRRDDRRDRRDDRRDRRDDRRDNRGGNYGGAYNNGGYFGTVTRVKSSQQFDVSIDGKTYNVYTNSYVPGRLSNGDRVRVYGDRVGNNDIRNASIQIVGNR